MLRNILAEIMMEILQKGQGYEHKVIESTHNLISCLISDFCYVVNEDGKFQNETGGKTSKIREVDSTASWIICMKIMSGN